MKTRTGTVQSTTMLFAILIAAVLSLAASFAICPTAYAAQDMEAATVSVEDEDMMQYFDMSRVYTTQLETYDGPLKWFDDPEVATAVEKRIVYAFANRVDNQAPYASCISLRDLHIGVGDKGTASHFSAERKIYYYIAKNYFYDARFVVTLYLGRDSSGRTYLNAVHVQFGTNGHDAAEFNAALDKLKAEVPENWSDLAKAKKCYEYVIANCDYDGEAGTLISQGKNYDTSVSSAYGCLVNGRALCGGYALGLAMALNAVGVEAVPVGTSDHAWTKAKINGHWYNLDATAGDMGADGVSYIWFMKSDKFVRDTNGDGSQLYVGGDRFDAKNLAYDYDLEWGNVPADGEGATAPREQLNIIVNWNTGGSANPVSNEAESNGTEDASDEAHESYAAGSFDGAAVATYSNVNEASGQQVDVENKVSTFTYFGTSKQNAYDKNVENALVWRVRTQLGLILNDMFGTAK